MAAEKTSPLLLERYELKYHIHHDMIEPISKYIENIGCYLDKYSGEDQTYRINSLYLDSRNFLFLRRTLNRDDRRFNMRIRSYGDDPKGPYFLEVKYKEGEFCKKYRHPISDEEWKAHFEGRFDPPTYSEMEASTRNFQIFERLATTHEVEPKILTQYRRKAYLSEIDDYARVTFDMDLRYHETDCYVVNPSRFTMKNYDNPMNFKENTDVILELKCTTQVPFWFLDLIKTFNLQRSGFSKYVSSSSELISMSHANRFERIGLLD